jgi:S1-C subfamily serine protease
MTTAPTMTRRGPLIAFVSAGLALVVAIVAVVVVVTRGGDAPAGMAVDDGVAPATALAALQQAEVEPAPAGRGVVVKGGAPVLGLTERDAVLTINGRVVGDRFDFRGALVRAALADATVLYVEIERAGTPMLVRRKVDGDLSTAHRDARRATTPDPAGGYNPLLTPDPGLAPDPYAADPAADALAAALDAIKEVDDNTYEIPRSTVDLVLANPMAVGKGARVVPAIKNGQPEGFKLYAIRPSSLYAKLGFNNGDTLHAINGFELTSADKALEVYTKIRTADDFVVEITRRGRPMTLSYSIR